MALPPNVADLCQNCRHAWLFHITVTDLVYPDSCLIIRCDCREFILSGDVTVQT